MLSNLGNVLLYEYDFVYLVTAPLMSRASLIISVLPNRVFPSINHNRCMLVSCVVVLAAYGFHSFAFDFDFCLGCEVASVLSDKRTEALVSHVEPVTGMRSGAALLQKHLAAASAELRWKLASQGREATSSFSASRECLFRVCSGAQENTSTTTSS